MIELMGKTYGAFRGVEWIAPYAFGDNEIHLTWHDPDRMHIVSFDGGQTWSQPDVIASLPAAFGGPNEMVKDSDGHTYVVLATNGGVFTKEWLYGNWGNLELIDGREIDNHGQQITVCHGNQLYVVYYDRTGENTSWYSTRKVDSISIPRGDIPKPSETSTPPKSPGSELSTPTISPLQQFTQATINPKYKNSRMENPITNLVYGVIPSVLFISSVFVFILYKKKRR